MNDAPENPATDNASPSLETPAQKALRLKQAKLATRSQPGTSFALKKEARPKAGSTKPWMTR